MPRTRTLIPHMKYEDFAREVATFLALKHSAVIFSPIHSSQKQGYSFRFAFKERGEVLQVTPLDNSDALAKRLNELTIKRIVLKTGVTEKDILALIKALSHSDPPSVSKMKEFEGPNIEIHFEEAGQKQRVVRLAGTTPEAIQPPFSPHDIEPAQPKPEAPATKKPIITLPTLPPSPKSEILLPQYLQALSSVCGKLRTAGKQLNRSAQEGRLTDKQKTEIEEWITKAENTIKQYLDEVERYGWDKELLGLRDGYCRLEELRRRSQERLGEKIEEIEIPPSPGSREEAGIFCLTGNSGQESTALPPHRTQSKAIIRPKNIPFEGIALGDLFTMCCSMDHDLSYGPPNKKEQQRLMRIAQKLEYLLHADNLEKEFSNVTGSRPLSWYRREFERFLRCFKYYIPD